jgi:hypothetical protein
MDIMKHYELCSVDEKLSFTDCTYTERIWIKVVDNVDKAILETIIEFAKSEGITDLYLLDKEFVKTALEREFARRKEGAD